MRLTLLLTAVLLLMACATTRPPTLTNTTNRHSYERYVDTITRTIVDSSTIRALLECDSLGRVRVADLKLYNSMLQRQIFELKDNELYLQSMAVQTERVREVVKTDTLMQYIEIPVPYPEIREINAIHWWQRWLIWIGVFYLLRLAVRLIISRGKLTFKELLKII